MCVILWFVTTNFFNNKENFMDKYIDVHCEGFDEFEVFDLGELLERYFEDGFTLDSLNLILETNIDDVSDCSVEDQVRIFEFLSFLYVQKISQDDYLLSIVDSLDEMFHITKESIAKYVGLSLNELDELIKNPTKHTDKLEAAFRLMNLFNVVSKSHVPAAN